MRTGHRDSDAFFLEASTAVLMRLQFLSSRRRKGQKRISGGTKRTRRPGVGGMSLQATSQYVQYRLCSQPLRVLRSVGSQRVNLGVRTKRAKAKMAVLPCEMNSGVA